jgi:alkylhydroperoxidase family enzyme
MRNRAGRERVAAADRHADRVAALRRAVFDSDAVTDRAARAAAATGGELPEALRSYLSKVREASYHITDADFDALRSAGHSDEEIFELTVAAALGAALRSRDAGLRALRGEI